MKDQDHPSGCRRVAEGFFLGGLLGAVLGFGLFALLVRLRSTGTDFFTGLLIWPLYGFLGGFLGAGVGLIIAMVLIHRDRNKPRKRR